MGERKAAKLAANNVLIGNGLTHVTLDNLAFLLDRMGYEIVDYSKTGEDKSTWLLLERYGLTSVAQQNYAFLYAQGDARYIFVDEGLTESEKTYAFAHELGHICMGHVSDGMCSIGSFHQEHEANEFAHYLLSPSTKAKTRVWVSRHKLIASLALVGVLGGGVVFPVASVVDSRSYHGGYYVTPRGTHYHIESCYTIQGHETRELSKEEFGENKYLPCSICIND